MKKIFSISMLVLLFSLRLIAIEIHLAVDSGYAEVNGTKLYYEVSGTGVSIVLIHGSFGDRRHWDSQFNELAEKYKVVRYDVRGYGKSALPKPDEVYKDADDLNALMDFLKIKRAHICGLSMGSIIAIDFALAYPQKCISLIPIGPRVAGDGVAEYKTPGADTLRNIMAKTTEILKSKGAKEATDYLWTGDHSMSKAVVSAKTREALLKMGYEYSWWRYLNNNKRDFAFPAGMRDLNNIKTPTLVITADHDLQLCEEIADIIVKEIAGAKLISIKNAGHIMNMDNPREFNKVISQFIDKIK